VWQAHVMAMCSRPLSPFNFYCTELSCELHKSSPHFPWPTLDHFNVLPPSIETRQQLWFKWSGSPPHVAKAKSVPLHATRLLGGEEVELLLILDLGTRRGEWSASRPGRGERTSVPEAGSAPVPDWTQKLEEKSFHLCRESNPDRPVVQPVARHYPDRATRLKRHM
jgi:hypothetical protein